MERPVEILADLLEDVGGDLREADLALARLGEAACEDDEGDGTMWCDAIRGRRADGTEEVVKGTLPGDVSMLRRVLETMAAFLSTTNSKPSALMSLTTPAVSSSSSSSWGWWCSRGGGILRPATD
jgi:hypothetical protein